MQCMGIAARAAVLFAAVAVGFPNSEAAAQFCINGDSGSNAASASGGVAGAQAGYNWQQGALVYGVETDLSGANIKSSAAGGFTNPFPCTTNAASASAKIDWYGTLRGRAGWATGNFLFYGTGGLAYGKADLNGNFRANDLPQSLQTSSTRTGWAAGGGVEYLLQPNLTLNFGYQYVDLGTLDETSAMRHFGSALHQTASARAAFQTVTVGLNWRFAPADMAPMSWAGGYFGGHGGGGWGDGVGSSFSAVSCFTGATQIAMADGTSRPIAAVKIGDEVLGENGEVNRVVTIETPALGTRKLYAFNGGPAFVTPEHPFMTRAGWKSIDPQATLAETGSFSVGALKVGDDVVKLAAVTIRARPMTVAFGGAAPARALGVEVETKPSALNAIAPHDGDPSMTVYNLRLDGNHTYFANSYLVHNK